MFKSGQIDVLKTYNFDRYTDFLAGVTLKISNGTKYAYIDSESIFEYEVQNDIKNTDGGINQADHSGHSF